MESDPELLLVNMSGCEVKTVYRNVFFSENDIKEKLYILCQEDCKQNRSHVDSNGRCLMPWCRQRAHMNIFFNKLDDCSAADVSGGMWMVSKKLSLQICPEDALT